MRMKSVPPMTMPPTLRARIRTVYGNWLAANPAMKDFWLKEYARLAAKKSGFLGFCQSQNSLGHPASDTLDPFYKLSIEIGAPV